MYQTTILMKETTIMKKNIDKRWRTSLKNFLNSTKLSPLLYPKRNLQVTSPLIQTNKKTLKSYKTASAKIYGFMSLSFTWIILKRLTGVSEVRKISKKYKSSPKDGTYWSAGKKPKYTLRRVRSKESFLWNFTSPIKTSKINPNSHLIKTSIIKIEMATMTIEK